MHPLDLSMGGGGAGSTGRMSMYNRIVASQLAQSIPQQTNRLLRRASILTTGSAKGDPEGQTKTHRQGSSGNDGRVSAAQTPYLGPSAGPSTLTVPGGGFGIPSPTLRRVSYAARGQGHHNRNTLSPTRQQSSAALSGYAPVLETVSKAAKDPNHPVPLPLPDNMTTEDFTRAVAVTVSALRQRDAGAAVQASAAYQAAAQGDAGGHGGHEAPSWSRATSATVLLCCTALYAAIAGGSPPRTLV